MARSEYELLIDDGTFDPGCAQAWLDRSLPSGSRDWILYQSSLGHGGKKAHSIILAVRRGTRPQKKVKIPLLSLSKSGRTGAFVYIHEMGHDVFSLREGCIVRFESFDESNESLATLHDWIVEASEEYGAPSIVLGNGVNDATVGLARIKALCPSIIKPSSLRAVRVTRLAGERKMSVKRLVLATLTGSSIIVFAASLAIDSASQSPSFTQPSHTSAPEEVKEESRFTLPDLFIGLLASLPDEIYCTSMLSDLSSLSCSIQGIDAVDALDSFMAWSGASIVNAVSNPKEGTYTAHLKISDIATPRVLSSALRTSAPLEELQRIGLAIESEEWLGTSVSSVSAKGSARGTARSLGSGEFFAQAISLSLKARGGMIELQAQFPNSREAHEHDLFFEPKRLSWNAEELERVASKLGSLDSSATKANVMRSVRVSTRQCREALEETGSLEIEDASPSMLVITPRVSQVAMIPLHLPERAEVQTIPSEAPEWLKLIAKLESGYAFKDERSGRFFVAGNEGERHIVKDEEERILIDIDGKRYSLSKGGR